MLKHGHSGRGKMTEIYHSWQDMIYRCTNSNYKDYKNYGGRGIGVCELWLDFENFNNDMGIDWRPGLTLERKNNNKGYSLVNCYWATRIEQARNRRNNHFIFYDGKSQCLAVWAEETGMAWATLYARICRYDWTVEQALTTPVRTQNKNRKVS